MSVSIRIRTSEVENTSDLAELLADPNVKAIKEFDDIITLEFKNAEIVQEKEFFEPWQKITLVIAELSENRYAVVKSVISDGDNDEVFLTDSLEEAKEKAEEWKWDDP